MKIMIVMLALAIAGCLAEEPREVTNHITMPLSDPAASEPSLPNTTGCYRDGCLVCCPYWTEWGTGWNCTTDAQCECASAGGWWVRCGVSMCCILDY